MANYRDDTQETAVASNATWGGLIALVGEAAKATSALIFGLLVLHSESIAASDAVTDRANVMATDQAVASDQVLDVKRAAHVFKESAQVVDWHRGALRVLHAENATAQSLVIDRVRAVIIEHATVADQALPQRRVADLLTEQAKALDFSARFAVELVQESADAGDLASGRARQRSLAVSAATLSDEVPGAHQAVAPVITESARLVAVVLDQLLARDLLADGAMIEDQSVSDVIVGQAWTAGADSWAMSRYTPHPFDSLAVIDGKLYGVASDGVYVMDARDQALEVRIKTGKLDVGQGMLVHPHQAFIEYALDGTASLAVTTTQSGAAQTYAYPLAVEPAAELTNGRFVLGKGLRGRHFAFELQMQARSGVINDLRVDSAPTNRRV